MSSPSGSAKVTADEALAVHLVSDVVEPKNLMNTTVRLVEQVCVAPRGGYFCARRRRLSVVRVLTHQVRRLTSSDNPDPAEWRLSDPCG